MKKLVFGVVSLLVALFVTAGSAQAFQIIEPSNTSGNARVESGKSINDTIFAAGQSVDLRGSIGRSAILAGNNINVDDTVGGDVFAAGQTVTISGTVGGDVIAAGASIVINDGAEVQGDVLGAAGTIEIAGTVRGKVNVGTGDLTVASTGSVGGNIKVNANSIQVNSGARVGGDITGEVTKDFTPSSGATVEGKIDLTKPSGGTPMIGARQANAAFGFLGLSAAIYSILTALILGLIINYLAPKFFNSVRDLAFKKPGNSFLAGFLVFLVSLPAILLLFILILTIPVAFLVMLTLGILAIIGNVMANLWVGDLVSKKTWSPLIAISVGALILIVIKLLPLIGALASFVAMMIGFGAVVLHLWEGVQKAK